MQPNAVPHSPILKFSFLIYRSLLYAYPARFRREYGEPMAQLFRDDAQATLRNHGILGLLGFWLFTLVDLSKTIFMEHLSNMKLEAMVNTYHDIVSEHSANADQLEQVYKEALKGGDFDQFKSAIEESYQASPDNLLFAAWFYRLKNMPARVKGAFTAWGWAIPLAAINCLLFWLISDQQSYQLHIVNRQPAGYSYTFPLIGLLAAPLGAAFVLLYLTAVSRRRWVLSAGIGIIMLVSSAYVIQVFPQVGSRIFRRQYIELMAMHLPLLAWAGVGVFAIGDHPDFANRFAFLVKSLEVFIMGGLFIIAGTMFAGITVALFAALDIQLPDAVTRLLLAGGGGLIPVVATAVLYNPTVSPAEQAFEEGLSKLIALLMRILLPLTLLVLLVYVAFIPFNFQAPFENRDVLITYNMMQFAVIALLVGATPVSLADVSPGVKNWLRRGIIVVAALTLIVSVYALAAILYRTSVDRLTPNRLAFIGWNIINIGLLSLLLFFQRRGKQGHWLTRMFQAYGVGTVGYAVWTLAMILVIPWVFRTNQGNVELLPPSVQEIIDYKSGPILLTCFRSPHVYLLQDGKKRWIDTMETFEAQGYVWDDVNIISCYTLDSVPDGLPIPEDAGSPPDL